MPGLPPAIRRTGRGMSYVQGLDSISVAAKGHDS
jgi:hypothetical protein